MREDGAVRTRSGLNRTAPSKRATRLYLLKSTCMNAIGMEVQRRSDGLRGGGRNAGAAREAADANTPGLGASARGRVAVEKLLPVSSIQSRPRTLLPW